MTTRPDDFGPLLRRFRKASHLSQEDVAEKAGVDASYISKLECGRREPPGRDLVLKIASALRLDDPDTNKLLISAGFAPLSRSDDDLSDPTLGLIADLLRDDRLAETELNPLKEYARLLDQLRRSR